MKAFFLIAIVTLVYCGAAYASPKQDMFDSTFLVTQRPAVPSDRYFKREDVLQPSQPFMRSDKDMFDNVRSYPPSGADVFVVRPPPVPPWPMYDWPKN